MSRFVKLTYYCRADKCCFYDIKESRKPSVVVNVEQIVTLWPKEFWGFCEGNENYPYRQLNLANGESYLLPIDTADFLEKVLFENQ